ncbi:uncharacterized protein DEA37_0010422, partial [Paragonimus westermani]
TEEVLQEFPLVYRTTPNWVTPDSRSLAEALVGHKLLTVHHAFIPTNEPTQVPCQNLQNGAAIRGVVYARDYRLGHNCYRNATESARHGRVMHGVSVSGTIWERHRKQLYPPHTTEKTTDDRHLLPLDILLDTFATLNTETTTVTSSNAEVTTNLLPSRLTDNDRRSHRPMQLDTQAKC